jgi:hypothetical protein
MGETPEERQQRKQVKREARDRRMAESVSAAQARLDQEIAERRARSVAGMGFWRLVAIVAIGGALSHVLAALFIFFFFGAAMAALVGGK